jgi:hypothetical protein
MSTTACAASPSSETGSYGLAARDLETTQSERIYSLMLELLRLMIRHRGEIAKALCDGKVDSKGTP